MKKNYKSYWLGILLVILTITLPGCTIVDQSKKDGATKTISEEGSPTNGMTLPLTEEPITLTVFAGLDSNLVGLIDDYNENGFFQELESRTGVHLEFIMPSTEKEQEVYNDMIASGNLADIITHEGNEYPEGMDAAIDDGYYLDLTPYLDTYLKDYNKVRLSDPFIEKCTTTAMGRVAACYIIYTEPQGPWMGLQLRKDWLDDLGLEVPVTFADWEEMLTLFKKEKGAYAPLSIGQYGYMNISHALSAGFGVTEDFMQIDGKVIYGPVMEGWRAYLTLLNDWYKKGLVDPDFMTNGAWQVDTNMVTSGETGAWNAMYTMISQYEAGGLEVIPVASPVLKEGDKLHIRREDSYIGNEVAISKNCKYPEIAMQLLNYLYTEEGALLGNYGVEHDTFVYDENGKPVTTDKISNNGLYSMPQAQALYLLPPSRFGGSYDWTRELTAVPEKDIVAYDIWSTADASYILPDQISYAGGEAGELAAIVSSVTEYVNECNVKFITGVMDIETDWDTYVATIKELGIDRAIEITQGAYERFHGNGN